MAAAVKENSILFVDDEKRVLTSMRAMFRRDYNVLLANSGQEALDILRDQSVDVVVSDQRMPGMTGVEVLKEVKELAPNAMRILLTGYADLNAIEASINDAEVFRYLMKPCPSVELKETIAMAANVARNLAAEEVVEEAANDVEAPADSEPSIAGFELIDMSSAGQSLSAPAAPAKAEAEKVTASIDPESVELLVLTKDDALVDALGDALHGSRRVHHAKKVEEAVELLEAHPIGVLVTDTALNEKQVEGLTSELKQHVPELITIIASERSDAQALINMINYGQIFRFLLKPLQVGQTRLWVESAVSKHVELARNPELVKRHQVKLTTSEGPSLQGIVSGALDRVKRIRGRFFQSRQMA
jgi:DNA-binding NtrC family response regulator